MALIIYGNTSDNWYALCLSTGCGSHTLFWDKPNFLICLTQQISQWLPQEFGYCVIVLSISWAKGTLWSYIATKVLQLWLYYIPLYSSVCLWSICTWISQYQHNKLCFWIWFLKQTTYLGLYWLWHWKLNFSTLGDRNICSGKPWHNCFW